MGSIGIEGDEVVIKDLPPYLLPYPVPRELVEALVYSNPGDEYFIGEVMKDFTPQTKLDFKNAARREGGTLYRAYCAQAGRWAAVVNQDNKWHLGDFRLIYHAELNTSWAHEIVLTDAAIRFVVSPKGVLTFPEFQYEYGVSIVEHLDQWQTEVIQTVFEVKKHITADIIKRRLLLIDPADNVISRLVTGLESIEPSKWPLPEGHHFLDVEE